jgi:hypothetical protein
MVYKSKGIKRNPANSRKANNRLGRQLTMAKEKEVIAEKDLVIGREILDEANLGKRLSIIIRKGETHIVPKSHLDAQESLDELAGCLGQESASEYDSHLKMGVLYENR